jgi:GT2 family glycosyltransferase
MTSALDALDIIIASYNTSDDLASCLQSLVDHPPVRPHHIWVVDNASRDDSIEMVRRRYPAVRLLPLDHNAGFAAANNRAIRQGSAPLVLLLNPDTLVPDGALDTLIGRLDATGAVAAGPRLVDDAGHPELSWGSMLTPLGETRQIWRRRHPDRWTTTERMVDWVSGACLLVRRDAAVAAGLLDERYFMYEEDVDFCAAIRAQGGRVLFTPAAQIVHRRGRSFAAGGRAPSALYDRSHVAFYQKHAPRWVPLLRAWLSLRGRPVRDTPPER